MNNTSVTIEMLTNTNFKKWKEEILYALAMGDMDFALREDELAKPNDQSTNEEKKFYAKWEKSNRLSLMAMKRAIPEHLKSGLPDEVSAKDFLAAVEQRYFVSEKAEAGTLMSQLTNMKYNNVGSVRDYILSMVHIQNKLKGLKLDLPDDFIVLLALNSLPPDFSQIKTAYNVQNATWSVNDLIAKCYVEQKKLRREKERVLY